MFPQAGINPPHITAGEEPVSIVPEVGWASGLLRTSAEKIAQDPVQPYRVLGFRLFARYFFRVGVPE